MKYIIGYHIEKWIEHINYPDRTEYLDKKKGVDGAEGGLLCGSWLALALASLIYFLQTLVLVIFTDSVELGNLVLPAAILYFMNFHAFPIIHSIVKVMISTFGGGGSKIVGFFKECREDYKKKEEK